MFLVDVDLEVLAAQLLDDPPQEHDARVRVAVLGSRREKQLRVGQHRRELFPRRRLERVPWLVAAPGPRRRTEPGACCIRSEW